MKINSVELRVLKMRLLKPFRTSFGVQQERYPLLVRLDIDGRGRGREPFLHDDDVNVTGRQRHNGDTPRIGLVGRSVHDDFRTADRTCIAPNLDMHGRRLRQDGRGAEGEQNTHNDETHPQRPTIRLIRAVRGNVGWKCTSSMPRSASPGRRDV